MVLAETLTYFFGGLSLAVALEGLQGIRRCLQPLRPKMAGFLLHLSDFRIL